MAVDGLTEHVEPKSKPMTGRGLPDDWRLVQIGALIENQTISIRNGFAQGGFNEDGRGVPHLRPFNVTVDGTIALTQIKSIASPSADSAFWVRQGDVIFNNTNTEELVGKTAYFDLTGHYVLSNHMTLIRVKKSDTVDAFWLAKYLHYLWHQRLFQGLCRRHVNQASVGLEKLRTVELVLPPLPEQRGIARVLRAVQAAKEARERELALERERKAALMAHLFTHGTRSEPTKQTEIGEMPEGWHFVTIGDIANITSGGTPDRGNPGYWHGEIPWVKTGEINYGVITNTEERITQLGLDNSAAKIIPAGAILMAMYGQGVTRGRVAVLGIDAAINQACAAISTKQDMLGGFLFHFLASSYERIRNLGYGANQKNLNAQMIRGIGVALPPLAQQQQIGDLLFACDTKIAALEQENMTVDELFQAVLEELMTGKMRTIHAE